MKRVQMLNKEEVVLGGGDSSHNLLTGRRTRQAGSERQNVNRGDERKSGGVEEEQQGRINWIPLLVLHVPPVAPHFHKNLGLYLTLDAAFA